jgi:predicted PurR-regulated permease PerM
VTTNPIGLVPVEKTTETPPQPAAQRPTNAEIAAWVMVGAGIVFVLFEHLVSALIAGLALYLILDRISDAFGRRVSGKTARPLALVAVVFGSAAIVSGGVALAITLIRHSAGRIPDMMNQMANILLSTQAWLGGYGQEIIPDVMTDAETFKAAIADWLKEHAQTVRAAGSYLSMGLVHVIMGGLLAVLVFLRHVTHHDESGRGPLSRQLFEKTARFASVFSQIAMAQIKISAVNTSLTAIYLLIILPMFGHSLPFKTTLIVLTFIAGLIPVLGNLISNTVITILSLGISVGTAIASLVFLILIHKLEYIVNSKIVGGQTDSQAWEILMAIIIGESAFGAGGVIMGPIVYAFVKRELRDRGLV